MDRRLPRIALVSLLLAAVPLSLSAGCGSYASPEEEEAGQQILAEGFVDSWPANGEEFAAVPREVLVDFDMPLAQRSGILVTRRGVDVTLAATRVDGTSMRVPLDPDAGTGRFTVQYTAYPRSGGGAVGGSFVFDVDRNLAREYEDRTGEAEVRIVIGDAAFVPPWVTVDRGARVVWVNTDAKRHFIGSDPYPTQGGLPDLDSPPLAKGDSYSYVFDRPGEWTYHCSSHYPGMRGRVLVLDETVTGAAPPTGGADPSIESRTPAFSGSVPSHGQAVAAAPEDVVVRFADELGPRSWIMVSNGPVQASRKTVIAEDRRSMSVPVDDVGHGMYLVRYRAYLPDGGHYDGRFSFRVR